MKSAFLIENRKIILKEIPLPKIDENEILLNVKSCSICGSDMKIYKYGSNRINLPHILGHEIAGVISAKGKKIVGFEEGDIISLSADIPCGKCEWCKKGLSNNCIHTIALGHEYQGGFAEYIKLDKRFIDYGPIVKSTSGLSTDILCLAEPIACCINGIQSTNMNFGDKVLIIGSGPIGCILGLLSKLAGASEIIMSDISETRLKLAEDIVEPNHTIDYNNGIREATLNITNGEGVDKVFVACPSEEAQKEAIYLAKKRGVINFFSGLANKNKKINIDTNVIHYKEIIVLGTHGSTPQQHKQALKIIESGNLPFNKLISKKYPLEKINEAFQNLETNKNIMKIVINP